MDSDGPEPLATVGQLSSPHFASFFEPPLYTPEDPSSLFDKRPADIPSFPLPPPPHAAPAHAPARASVIAPVRVIVVDHGGHRVGQGPSRVANYQLPPLSGFREWHLNGSIFGVATIPCHAIFTEFEGCKGDTLVGRVKRLE